MTKRKFIRNYIKNKLIGKTKAKSNVYTNRAEAEWFEDLPAINILTEDETSDIFNQSPRMIRRELRIKIELIAEKDENIDDYMDDFEEEVETVMNNIEDKMLVEHCYLKESTLTVISEGKRPVSSYSLVYEIVYIDEYGRYANTDFDKIQATWDCEFPSDTLKAIDEIDLY